MVNLVNEVTPLLQSARRIPWFQLSILFFLQALDPLTSQVTYPFVPELIHDIGITFGNGSRVGYYVALLQSLFYFTEALTVLHWSRMSDKVGRKPVILIGLFGSLLSMLCFGLSRSLWGLILCRCIHGALNGNSSVIKSMTAEMVDPSDLARVYAFMPLAWSMGETLGPMVAGYFSRARLVKPFPDSNVSNQIEFLKFFPYILPSAVPMVLTILALLVTSYFLKETVKSPLPASTFLKSPKNQHVQAIGGAVVSTVASQLPLDPSVFLPVRELLTRRVVIAVVNHASLSLVDSTFRAIQPLFLATPLTHGGLGMDPSTIGNLVAVYGTLNGCIQVLFFPKIHDYLGTKNTFMVGVASAIPSFLVFPIASFLAKTRGFGVLLWIAVGIQTILPIGFSLSFGAIFMYITAASPNRESIGATNGLSQMLASTMSGAGSGFANGLFSVSIEKNYLSGNLVYYVLVATAAIPLVVATYLPHRSRNQ